MHHLDWRQIRAAVFDVDGTLYSQARMRLRIAGDLLSHAMKRGGTVYDARILRKFRSLREAAATKPSPLAGLMPFDQTASELGMPSTRVRAVVEEWMMVRPLRHLASCRYRDVDQLFAVLRRRGVHVAVLSDYPAATKLAHLGLHADLVKTALDPDVQCLKPNPRGLLRIIEALEVSAGETVFIGDRDDRDGACARAAGVHFLHRGGGGVNGFSRYAEIVEHAGRGLADQR